MRCDTALAAISAAADGEAAGLAGDALAEHVAACPRCRDFERHVARLRAALRVEPVEVAPDIAAAVLAALPEAAGATPGAPVDDGPTRLGLGRRERRSLAMAATAAALAGAVAGATFMGLGRQPGNPAAADIPARIVTAQHDITTLDEVFELTEHGRRDVNAPRRFAGHLAYAAPESLRLTLREPGGHATAAGRAGDAEAGPGAGEPMSDAGDDPARRSNPAVPSDPSDPGEPAVPGESSDRSGPAAVPSGSGEPGESGLPARAGDVHLVAGEDRWWLEAPRLCAPGSGMACAGGITPWSQAVVAREPFSDAAPIPLELINPVDSFTLAATPPALGERTLAGRPAVGVSVTAAQVAALLAGLSPAGDLRAVHPSDPVELWLDRDHLVPLALVVRAAPGEVRARWAAAHGYDDRPDGPVIEMVVTSISVNGDVGAGTFDAPPRGAGPPATRIVDEGFTEGPAAAAPMPRDIPPGFRAHRSGIVSVPGAPPVDVRTWTDGRAWLKVRATTSWDGPRIFGDLGGDLRVVDLGPAGRAYASADGTRVALHGDDLNVVLTGSVPPATLQAIAASAGIVGRAVPEGWQDAGSTTLARAAAETPGLLVARGLDGFGPPAVTVTPTGVTQSYAGPGNRGFQLTHDASPHLAPPAGPDAIAVEVRGTTGRYNQERGEIEWVEAGTSHSLRSPTLTLAELLDIADRLLAAR